MQNDVVVFSISISPIERPKQNPKQNPLILGFTQREKQGSAKTMEIIEENGEGSENISEVQVNSQPSGLSKTAQKKRLKQLRYEDRKAEKKAKMKVEKKREGERKRREWEEKLASLSEEERSKLIEERKGQRKERMEKRSEEREHKIQRLTKAKENGQNIIIDLEFSHLMSRAEIQSLVQQVPLFTVMFVKMPQPSSSITNFYLAVNIHRSHTTPTYSYS